MLEYPGEIVDNENLKDIGTGLDLTLNFAYGRMPTKTTPEVLKVIDDIGTVVNSVETIKQSKDKIEKELRN
jgi:hypothetical protein